MKSEKFDYHEERMQVIHKLTDRDRSNVLCYISGWMGNDPKFQEAFKSALDDGIFFD